MNIIPARAEHLEKLVELHQLLYLEELKEIRPFIWSERSWIEANLGDMYVMEDKGILLGAVCVKPFAPDFVIETLVVGLNYQDTGIGRLLVEYTKTLTRTKRGKKLGVCSFVAYKKRRFYENCGFVYIREEYYENQANKKYPYHCMAMDI